jgi:Flp pilus assembly pilin Flp
MQENKLILWALAGEPPKGRWGSISCACLLYVLHETLAEFPERLSKEFSPMTSLLRSLLFDEEGQDIAEYAVLVAAILIIVIGTIRLIGSNSNTVFSNVASTIQ